MENRFVSNAESFFGSRRNEWRDESLAEFMERIETSSTDTDVDESEDMISHEGLLGTWRMFHDELDDLLVLECLSFDDEDELVIIEDSEHSQTRRRCGAFDDFEDTD
jgi:hypothetical protein